MAREYTDHLLELIDEGILDKDHVILACVKYMTEEDVKDMMLTNDLINSTFNLEIETFITRE